MRENGTTLNNTELIFRNNTEIESKRRSIVKSLTYCAFTTIVLRWVLVCLPLDVIADIDREPEFWHGTKSIKNISKTGNIIEREAVIAFRNSICREIVELDVKKSIKVEIIEGPIKGKKTIAL